MKQAAGGWGTNWWPLAVIPGLAADVVLVVLVVQVVLAVRVAKAIKLGIHYYLARASRLLRLSGRL